MPLSQNARGALMMTLAMGVFTCNDALVKSVTPFMSTGQIMFIRGAMTTLLLLAMAWRMGAFRQLRSMAHPLLSLRSIFEIGGTITYITALGQIELANAGAIMQFIPLAVTLGASLFFGEKVGWRRWLAILIGFVGVLIILRPGPSAFAPASLLVVAAVFLTAARDLTTRKMGMVLPAVLVSLFSACTNTLFGAILIAPMGGWHPVSAESFGYLAVASILILTGYQAIVHAMRAGDVSFVAPFRYTSLIFALGLGFLVFGEMPDEYMMLGSCLIIASGLYAFYRERKRAQPIAAVAGTRTPN